MLQKTFLISCVSVAVAMLLVLFSLPTPKRTDSDNSSRYDLVLIKHATVFDGEAFRDNIDIEVSNGVISKLSQNVKSKATVQIDASGKTIIPGLIDAHTHSYGNALETALIFGVTTQVDMFTPPRALDNEISIRNDAKQYKQADLFSAGMLATVDGGHGTQFGIPIETLAAPNEANAWVEKRIAEGSDFIKLVYMPYSNYYKSLDRETAAAIIQAAHNKDLMVVAHISTQRAAMDLLEEGIDGLVHIFADEEVSPEFLQKAKASNVFVIPTLSVIASAGGEQLGEALANDEDLAGYLATDQVQHLRSDFGDELPGFKLSTAIHNTKSLHQSGVRILAGSDAPNPGTAYGATIHQELELLTQAGFSPSQALNAASKDVADAFGLNLMKLAPRGQISIGAKADFIMLDSSPSTDIKATRNISRIFKNGSEVKRVLPSQVSNSKVGSSLLSNFAEGLTSSSKWSWSKTDDSMANGASTVSLLVEDKALKVNATVNKGFMFPWAGAIVLGAGKVDISNYSAVSFKVRGTPGRYQVMMFSAANAGKPPSQSFSVNDEWQTIQLTLSDFRGLVKPQFSGLAIVAGPTLGEFEYYLDDVKLLK